MTETAVHGTIIVTTTARDGFVLCADSRSGLGDKYRDGVQKIHPTSNPRIAWGLTGTAELIRPEDEEKYLKGDAVDPLFSFETAAQSFIESDPDRFINKLQGTRELLNCLMPSFKEYASSLVVNGVQILIFQRTKAKESIMESFRVQTTNGKLDIRKPERRTSGLRDSFIMGFAGEDKFVQRHVAPSMHSVIQEIEHQRYKQNKDVELFDSIVIATKATNLIIDVAKRIPPETAIGGAIQTLVLES